MIDNLEDVVKIVSTAAVPRKPRKFETTRLKYLFYTTPTIRLELSNRLVSADTVT